jgi:hypothetical protein
MTDPGGIACVKQVDDTLAGPAGASIRFQKPAKGFALGVLRGVRVTTQTFEKKG